MLRRILLTLCIVVGAGAAPVAAVAHRATHVAHRHRAAHRHHVARGHATMDACATNFPATRDPANPLMLPAAPGADPLNGANLFVDGPRHGAAAGAIARLLGMNPDRMSVNLSWAQFQARISRGAIARKLKRNPGLARRVRLLEKIAAQPEEARFSP